MDSDFFFQISTPIELHVACASSICKRTIDNQFVKRITTMWSTCFFCHKHVSKDRCEAHYLRITALCILNEDDIRNSRDKSATFKNIICDNSGANTFHKTTAKSNICNYKSDLSESSSQYASFPVHTKLQREQVSRISDYIVKLKVFYLYSFTLWGHNNTQVYSCHI